MGNHTVKWLMAASTVAVIAISCFQVSWLKKSKKLIEEQFDQKVTMALCQSISDIESQEAFGNSCSINCCYNDLIEDQSFGKTVRNNLQKYKVDLDYEMSVLPCKPIDDVEGPYGCTLDGREDEASQWLAVDFPDKACYVSAKMNFMSLTSGILLGFIGLVFFWANYLVWKQKKLNKENVDFFNHMAHELRTPLTSISLATNLLSKQHAKLKDSKYFQVVQRENKMLKAQVEQLMITSKLEQTKEPLLMNWLDLGKLLHRLKLDFQIILEEKEASLNIEKFNPNLKVFGNEFHLYQAFKNIIDNAIKYGTENLRIDIEVFETSDGVKVNFKDNGIGIDAKDIPYVFDKYHRSDLVKSKSGFGLGLSYVKSVAELHNGFVKLISGLSNGSQFIFHLPNLK